MSSLNEAVPFEIDVAIGTESETRRPVQSFAPTHTLSNDSAAEWTSRYRKTLAVIDAAVVVAALGISQTARFGLEFQGRVFDQVELTYLAFLPLIAAAWWMLLCVFGSRERRILGIGPDEYKRVIVSTFTLFGLLAIGCMALKIDASRGYFALAFPIGLAGLLTERWTMRRWLTTQRKYGHFLSRVIVLGKAKDVRYVVSQIDKKSGAAYQVVGAALTKRKQRNFVDVDGRKIPILAGMDSIGDAVVDYNVDAVIIAGPVNRGSKYVQQLGWKLEESKTELVLATGLTNVAGPRIHTRPVEGLPLMHVELPHYSGAKHVAKRVSDIVLSAFALTALMPVFVAFALLIKRDSAGPVFFRQKRVGRDGSTFEMCKFRSMRPNAEAELEALKPGNEGSGPLFKLHDDPRVTKVGKWMRKYSLDELPQFWNVFKGDMSIVGPRPPLASEVAEYAESVHRRLYIKPGITGMWQVNGRSELGWDDSVRLDLYYVENWSLTGDLIIMWRTFRVMIHPVGAY